MKTTHTYLDQGITILNTRMNPSASSGQTRSAGKVASRPFITISRESCAGATALGQELVPLLNEHGGGEEQSWMFFDKDLIVHALIKHQLPERLADYLPEDRISEIKSLIGELVGLHPPVWELEHKVSEAIIHLAQMGLVILTGRASNLLTHDLPGGLHLRLVASMESRIKRMMKIKNCDAATARNTLIKTDHARYRYVHTRFQHDIEDPLSYDLMINTDHITTSCAARLVLQVLRSRVQDPAGTLT